MVVVCKPFNMLFFGADCTASITETSLSTGGGKITGTSSNTTNSTTTTTIKGTRKPLRRINNNIISKGGKNNINNNNKNKMRENNSGIRSRPMGLPFMFTLALALMVTMTDCRHLRQQSQSQQQQEPTLVEDIEDNEIGIDRNQNHHHRPHRPLHEQHQQEDTANQEEEVAAGQKDWVKISQAPIALLNEVELGETFEFECEAVGSPAPTVKWLKGSVPLLDEEIFETNMIPMGPSSGLAKVRARLYVRAASKLHHEGDYTCVAESGTQVATAHMRLVVLGNNNGNIGNNLIGSPSMSNGRNYTSPALLLQRHIKEARAAVHSPPRIVLYDTIYMDNIGSDIVLPCKTAGSPRPSVIWLNPADNIIDNDDLDLGGGGGGSDGRLTVLPDGRLRIRNIRWNDMGPYTCVVTNALGQDNITTFLYPMLAEK